MNILLIRPKPSDRSIGLHKFMVCEPLELEYISAVLKGSGHQVTILDMIFEHKPIRYFLEKYQPDIVGLTAYITHVNIIKQYAAQIKQYNRQILVVAGGVYAEVVPEDIEDSAIDLILHADALNAFKEIVSRYPQPVEYYRTAINGVWNGREKNYNYATAFNFPFPDREATAKYRNRYNYIFHSRCATIKTSFGCAYRCAFCFCAAITGNRYFERPVADVIAEMLTIKEKNIFIVDDNFLFKRERITEFCNLYRQAGLQKEFILFGRADFIAENEDMIDLLKKCGLRAVFIGLESFKAQELSDYNKRVSVETNEKAVRILEKYGLECYSGIIVGPDWDKEDFKNLAVWLNKFKRPLVNIQPLTPMPGTPVFNEYEQRLTMSRADFDCYDMAHLVIAPTKLTPARYYMEIVKTYYRTATSLSGYLYVIREYGISTFLRVFKGVMYVTYQYLKKIWESRN